MITTPVKKVILNLSITLSLVISVSGCPSSSYYVGGSPGAKSKIYSIIKSFIDKFEGEIWQKLHKEYFGVKELSGQIKLKLIFLRNFLIRCEIEKVTLYGCGIALDSKKTKRAKFEICRFLQTKEWPLQLPNATITVYYTLKRTALPSCWNHDHSPSPLN